MPLLALSMAAMRPGQPPRHAVLWALPLVLVKEDLGAHGRGARPGRGAVRGSRRWGVFALVFGCVAFLGRLALWLPHDRGAGGFAGSYAPGRLGEALHVLGEGAAQQGEHACCSC